MRVTKDAIQEVLAQFNPWWRGGPAGELPPWRRAVWRRLRDWLAAPPAHRALLVSGARQIGKTTLLLQAVDDLLARGTPAANVLYATFDHPILKLAGIDATLEAWREREPRAEGTEYLFLDEAQFIRDCGTWIKHQTDFNRQRRIVFTGSAMPLVEAGQESGVGRWHTLRVATLSFFEHVQLKRIDLPPLPPLGSFSELFDTSRAELMRIRELAAPYVAHFHDHLLRGGFPQTALIESLTQAQRLLREDIVDKVLKRDMTALFGVRRILELEHLFLYLCLHDGGLLNMNELAKNLEVKRGTVQHFLELLEACNLTYRLPPYGYGKEILRGRFKVYLADAAIAPATMLTGRKLLDDPVRLGVAIETAVLKHLFVRYQDRGVRFSYWNGRQGHEVDLVADFGLRLVPFEIKHRGHVSARDLKGLLELCEQKGLDQAFVVTRSLEDFGELPLSTGASGRVMQIPAALLCWWAGEIETRPDSAFSADLI